jgi:hypothetical protein
LVVDIKQRDLALAAGAEGLRAIPYQAAGGQSLAQCHSGLEATGYHRL